MENVTATPVLPYKLIQRVNPGYPMQPRKWYAIPCNSGQISISQLGRDIAASSGLGRGDVTGALTDLTDRLVTCLLDGQSLSLGELGSFHLSFGSEGVSSPEQFHTGLITRLKVVFVPGKEWKACLLQARFTRRG